MRNRASGLQNYELGSRAKFKGRVVTIRKSKKTVFLDLECSAGKIQGIVEKDDFKSNPIKVGDIVEGEGSIQKTKTGHQSVGLEIYTLLIRPENYRQIETNARSLVLDRSLLEKTIANFFEERGIHRVSTPILSGYSGSSDIIPFKTLHRGKKEYFLRFTMELELKKLVAKTQLPVFEIGSVFKDMGESARRSFEYQTCEACIPYLGFDEGLKMMEDLFRKAAKAFDIETGEIPKREVKDICAEILEAGNPEKVTKRAYKKEINRMIGPIIVTSPPAAWVSPLYSKNPDGTSREGRLIYGGFGTAIQVCDESTDYRQVTQDLIVQRDKLRAEGRSSEIDKSFIDTMKLGLPPSIGFHIGLDRLLMAFTNRRSIGEVRV